MVVRIRWKSMAAGSADDSGARLRSLLAATRRTRYYRPLKPRQLARYPRTSLAVYQANLDAFHNAKGTLPGFQTLFYPGGNSRKTAVLLEGFRGSKTVAVFPESKLKGLSSFRPEAIAGTLDRLLRLADDRVGGKVDLNSLKYAVIVFTRIGGECLTEECRSFFWDVFRVPVFEQYLGFANELLAAECEAHDGLHINCSQALFEMSSYGGRQELLVSSFDNLRYPALRLATGLACRIETSECACGSAAPRLVDLSPMASQARAAELACCVAG